MKLDDFDHGRNEIYLDVACVIDKYLET